MAWRILPLPAYPELPEKWPRLAALSENNSSVVEAAALLEHQLLQARYRLKAIYTRYQLIQETCEQQGVSPALILADATARQELIRRQLLWDFEALLNSLNSALQAAGQLVSKIEFESRAGGRDMRLVLKELLAAADKTWGRTLMRHAAVLRNGGLLQRQTPLEFVLGAKGWRLQCRLPGPNGSPQFELLSFGLRLFRAACRLDSALARLVKKYFAEGASAGTQLESSSTRRIVHG